MAIPQASKEIHALCYEHHIEMKKVKVLAQSGGTPTPAYACPQPGCDVHYGPSRGYFMAAKNGNAEAEILPRVMCARDGRAMYLAEVNPGKRNFRLWRCPECDSTRTNKENFIGELRPTPSPED